MRIDYILKAAAKRMNGVSVDCDSSFSTVAITSPGFDEIFLQGDDADNFIDQCRAMSERCQCLNFDVIELAMAEPYTDLWN